MMTDEAVETVREALYPYGLAAKAFDSLVQRLREAEERAEKAEADLDEKRHSAAYLMNEAGKVIDRVAQLETENERLREFYEAAMAVEEGVVSFDLHNETVDRLHRAREALKEEAKT